MAKSKNDALNLITQGLDISTFSSFRNRNFALFFIAQVLSSIGTWVQITAEIWLVLQLAKSGVALGVTNALQFAPLLLFGLKAGSIVDQVVLRRLLITTQSCLAGLALVLALLVAFELIQIWMIWIAALFLGVVKCFDMPGLQSFVKELVPDNLLSNAIALNNVVVSLGKMLGPAIGGLMIAQFGLALSFFVNAISFTIVVLVLYLLDCANLNIKERATKENSQVIFALNYVLKEKDLFLICISMFIIFSSVYNFQVIIPLLAVNINPSNSELFGILMSCLGAGAVFGSFFIASRVRFGLQMTFYWIVLLTLVQAGLVISQSALLAGFFVFALGAACSFYSITVNSTLQIRTPDSLRARVMALYTISILGSSVVGGPLFGWLSDQYDVKIAILVSVVITALVALLIKICSAVLSSRI